MLDNPPLLRRRREDRPNRFRRGVFLLPSLFTVANLFCGYACVVYSTRSDFDTAALFIGIAMILDTLDGFFARLTHSSSAFGVELDSLADVVSFGLAPAILAFTWGLWPLERLGWAAGFLYVTAAAMRLARFNVQSSTTTASTDKRYFVGMPSPAAASVIASTVYLYPYGLQEREAALPALAMVLVPAFLMVSTIRFRSVKAIDVGHTRSYLPLFLGAVALFVVALHPRIALVLLSYTYTAAALIMWGYTRLRRHASGDARLPDSSEHPSYERQFGRLHCRAETSRTRRSQDCGDATGLAGRRASATASCARQPIGLHAHSDHRHRQAHADRRPSTLAAIDLDRAAIQFDVAPRNRQAQSGPCRLGGEVRLEHASQCLLVHADAVVVNPKRHVVVMRRCVNGKTTFPGIACSEFSTMLARLRAMRVRSTKTRGNGPCT